MKEKFQNMTIRDSFMFAAVMSDAEKCRKLLEIILNIPILAVNVITEKTMAYHPEYHGVRLDVLAEEKGTHRRFNVEMQIKNEHNLPKRSRYYHSQIDMDMLLSGVDYEELPDCYVIFICDFDPFGGKRYVYTIQNICKEMNREVEDGAQTIWLSTKGKNEEDIPEGLVNFLQYIGNVSKKIENTYEGFPKELEDSIRAIKKNRDWEAKFMLLQEMIKEERKEAYAEGHAKGRAEGDAQGRAKERVKLARKLLANGTDPKLIAISLDMTIEEFEKWMKQEAENVD